MSKSFFYFDRELLEDFQQKKDSTSGGLAAIVSSSITVGSVVIGVESNNDMITYLSSQAFGLSLPIALSFTAFYFKQKLNAVEYYLIRYNAKK